MYANIHNMLLIHVHTHNCTKHANNLPYCFHCRRQPSDTERICMKHSWPLYCFCSLSLKPITNLYTVHTELSACEIIIHVVVYCIINTKVVLRLFVRMFLLSILKEAEKSGWMHHPSPEFQVILWLEVLMLSFPCYSPALFIRPPHTPPGYSLSASSSTPPLLHSVQQVGRQKTGG